MLSPSNSHNPIQSEGVVIKITDPLGVSLMCQKNGTVYYTSENPIFSSVFKVGENPDTIVTLYGTETTPGSGRPIAFIDYLAVEMNTPADINFLLKRVIRCVDELTKVGVTHEELRMNILVNSLCPSDSTQIQQAMLENPNLKINESNISANSFSGNSDNEFTLELKI